ncbi:MAG: M23 family metallopeptidase [Lysinibacillus sp.]
MGQQIEELFLSRQYDAVYDVTSEQFQQFIARAEFRQLCEEFFDGVKTLKLTHQNPFLHMHNYVWVDERKEKALFVTMDRNRVIQGLYMKPYVQFVADNKNYTKNMFRMPILDEWYVVWGGANEFQNYHYPYENQRYAYDLVKQKDFQSYDTHQHLYTSYYAYNEQVVAPCSGTIVSVVNDVVDNEIGQTNEEQPAGNYVVIEHAFDEYSFLAHFKQGSILVKSGDHVYAGQPLGRCGNSGNSTEPHIHFHVMDGPNFETAKSIRIRFTDRFEPVQGSAVNSVSYQGEERMDLYEKGEVVTSAIDILSMIQRALGGFFR